MSALLVPSLFVTSGVCAYAVLHHGIAALNRQSNRIHLLFAALSLFAMAFILAKAGGHQAQTIAELVACRRWEAAFICLIMMLLPWVIAEYTDVRPRNWLVGSTLFWILLFVVNLSRPYGLQFADAPRLDTFELPWGETVTDLRILRYGIWNLLLWAGTYAIIGYSVYAAVLLYRRGQREKARLLGWALAVFFGSLQVNIAVNLGFVRFVHLGEFGFIAMLLMMDLELMRESRDQRRRMRDVLDRLPAAICLKDVEGRFQLVNRRFEALFGVDHADIVGSRSLPGLPPQSGALLGADEQRAVRTRREIDEEYRIDWRGAPLILETHQFPLLRPDGTPYAICGVYVDITEDRRKDEMLGKLRRQIWHTDRVASTGVITGSLAHELVQPLAAILSNAQAGLRFLQRGSADVDEMREIFEDIVRDDKRAATVIHNLRTLLQRQETERADVDVATCIGEVATLLHSELLRHGVVLDMALQAGLTAHANRTQLQQVVLNLMLNAMEAMAGEPADQRLLQVRATATDGRLEIAVRDHGVGIDEAMLQRVFEGFYTTKPQGLGIGLDVCRAIVESHGGAIWAERNADRGVTFRFTLPRVDGAAGPVA